MKRLFTIILALALLSVAAIPSLAQGRERRTHSSNRSYYGTQTRYGNQTRSNGVYNSRSYYDYGNRSVWDKHRDKLTVAGGTVGGAIIGGLFGGKKGAAIGALAG